MSDRRYIAIVHVLPGRTRLRSPLLRRDEPSCERVADHLAARPGTREVIVKPYTGSVLITHARDVTATALADEAARVLGGATVLAPGESPPMPEHVPPFSAVARKLAQAVQEIDADIRRKTDGAVDLGTLATLGFFGAGAAEVAASGKLPLPPWFNLAWWGFSTFVTTEQAEIAAERPPSER